MEDSTLRKESQMFERLLIIARDFNQANHWAKEQRMSPGRWVYVSSYHNINGNAGAEYVMLDGWTLRPDAVQLKEQLEIYKCREREVLI
jgi:hypothetical protein